MRITDKYVFFWGSEFSNWYSCQFEYKGYIFANTEQAFMWEKAIHFGDTETAEQILQTPNPGIAKKLGRQVCNFNADEWMTVAFDIMVAVNKIKFSDPQLKELLISTKDLIIVEASPEDVIWGIGIHWTNDNCLDETKWRGQNLLGKALMAVRTELQTRELQLHIKSYQAAYVAKVMECLQSDPMADGFHKTYKELESYLWKLIEKDGSILGGLITAMEKHLEK